MFILEGLFNTPPQSFEEGAFITMTPSSSELVYIYIYDLNVLGVVGYHLLTYHLAYQD